MRFALFLLICVALFSTEGFSQNRGEQQGKQRFPQQGQKRQIQKPTANTPKAAFSVTLLGTQGPACNAAQSCPSAIVKSDDQYFLVDMGNGTQDRLKSANINYGSIAAVMLTHHHKDHSEEFVPIAQHVIQSSKQPIAFIGPTGIKWLYDFVFSYGLIDIRYRGGGQKKTDAEFKSQVTLYEWNGGNSLELNGVKITSVAVNHIPHSVAYRFEKNGRSIVISGDLIYSEGLVTLAKNADVLILEGNQLAASAHPQIANLSHAHASTADLARMAAEAHVKKLVFTHYMADLVDQQTVLAEVQKIYSGPVVFGTDFMEVVTEK